MRVSLRTFLRTAVFGDLHCGMSPAQVQASLGAPDDVGATSRRYRRSSIFRYGMFEVWFTKSPPQKLTSVFWEAGEIGDLRLPPHCDLEDWELYSGMTQQEVEGILSKYDLAFECGTALQITMLRLASGVVITFEESGGLSSIYG